MARPAQRGVRGAVWAVLGPGQIQCTKPEVQITCGTAGSAPAQMRSGKPCLRRGARELGPPTPAGPPPRSTHLEHKPDEDAEHQEEADVCMVVDDELLAEERVTFRPPTESHGSGRAPPAGARTLTQQPR